MKFPYGLADFYSIRKEGYFYQDRSHFLRVVEERGKQLVFLRPRRFGKSLWLSTLANYYDVARANEFATLFGDLAIGKNPPPLHNQHFILRWDFSKVAAFGGVDEIVQHLYNVINGEIKGFENRYRSWLPRAIEINPADAVASFNNLLSIIQLAVDSEPELERRYADLLMLLRPEQRIYQSFDILIEFKYVELAKVGLSAESVRGKTHAELTELEEIKDSFDAARTALQAYRQTLHAKYGALLKLRVYAVVSLGFERLLWQEVV